MTQKMISQKGIAQLVVIAVMAFLALGIPTATKLVQENQENRSKASEQNNFSCNTLRDVHKNFFDVCKDYDNICFNKINGEYQGCGNIAENNGGDCTDPIHNTNAATNILCSIKNDTSLSCDTLYEKKHKYFATCALKKNAGVCFNKQTGEYRGCDDDNSCKNANQNSNSDDLNKIFCSVKEEDSQLWTSQAGICGTVSAKTLEVTPSDNFCLQGSPSRFYFDQNDNRYYWRCGNVENLGNQAAICYATVNGIPGSSKISLDRKEISLGVGQTIKINATLTPPDSTVKIYWTTNMPEFFSVDSNGVVKTLKDGGSGNITAMTSKGQGASLRANTSIYSEKIDAKCGSAHNKTFSSIPENYLCEQSSAGYGQLKENKFYWTCSGENGGSSADCVATITKKVNATATPKPIGVDGVCGTVKYSQLSKNSPKDKNITLCKSGKLDDFFTVYENPNSTDLTYVWNCLGSNGGSDIQCNVADPNMIIDGICGKAKYDELTLTSDKNKPKLLCESGFVVNFVKTTPKCLTASNCPPSVYSWTCMNVRNGGKGVKCSVKQGSGSTNTPTPRPITLIKVNPTSLKLKVGQSQNLTYILTPSKSTDTVKWTVSADGLVKIQKLALKCNDSSNSKCLETPGTSHLQVTALKAGTVKIKLTTSSGKYAEVTVTIDKKPQSEAINGVCGPLTPSQVTDNIDKEKPQLLCKSGKVGNFTKTADAYWWDCNGINGGETTGCGFDNPDKKIVVNGSCGAPKYNQLTSTSDKQNPKLLCKTGKVSEFSKMTPNCSDPSNSTNCPPAFYSWNCLGSNGGKSVKCSIKSPTTYSYTIPATGIKVTPTSLELKVGQTAKISYVLTPKDTTNPVYSLIVGPKDLVKITQTTPPCPTGANCALAAPGIQYYNVTALKSGSVKIYFRTSSGKSASSTILINK